ncbi:hypothetical protein quinque_014003 [Culex quinquefasciatus]
MGLLIVNQKEFGIQGLLVETAVKYAESNKHVLFITEERIKNVTPDFLRNYNNAVYRKLKFIYSKSSAAILLKLNEDENIQISIILDTDGDDLLRSRRSSFFWQSDSTLSIRQPTYTKRRNPARTELQANVARTAILLVRNGLYHCLGRRRRQRSTPPRASRRPVTNDTLMCKLQFYDDKETST